MRLLANVNQLAHIFQLSRPTVNQRLQTQPYQMDGNDKLYDLEVVGPLLNYKSELKTQELREKTAKADNIEIEVAQKRSELVPIKEVAKFIGAQFANVRTRILSIPSRCAKELSLETNPKLIQDRLDQEVREALEELTADTIYEEMANAKQLGNNPITGTTADAKGTAEVKPS